MEIKYNKPRLYRIINDISTLTGISMSVLDKDMNTLVSTAAKNDFCSAMQKNPDYQNKCKCSDMTVLERCAKSNNIEHHICHAGLCDSAMPIIKNGIIAGYIIMGRIRSPLSPKTISIPTPESEDLKKLYDALPYFEYEKLECLHDLLGEVLFENAITIEYDELIEKVTNYINCNLKEDLTVTFLCRTLHTTKNLLYQAFRIHFNMTINEYIIYKRIEKAKQLLVDSECNISEVAEAVGISNYAYFCRLFKRTTALTPTQYREKYKV